MNDTPKPGLNRRDFMVGAGYGAALGAAAWLGAPASAHAAMLPFGTHLSYAQNGEDLVLRSLLSTLGIELPVYLDIGAYHPILGSNSYLFYLQGARGVLVEPNVDMVGLLASERPEDTIVNAGVGITDAAEADYYVLSWPQLNSFDGEAARAIADSSNGQVKLLRTVKMPLININRIIEENLKRAPDLLSIDVEGLDLEILQTLDFERWRPRLICAEHSDREALATLLTGKGYILRGMTAPNSIFLDTRPR